MQDISNGRMVMGIGRGDSSRRVVGLKPVKVDEFERRLRMIKDLMNGRKVEWNGKELELTWVRKALREIPMHVAGYGPRALGVAGRVGDGVIIQLADPQIIQWIMETARKAAEEEGRYGWESEIPAALTDYVKARKFYDYKEHSRVGAKHGEFVSDEICDRFCVLGTAEQATEKLRELESIGVGQFNIYLMTQGQEETLAAYGGEIIPQFSRVAA
jgi:alkanesulfonate monooxygenase SsuD/methylene tetrahydromethanopterin reductase-like flavin-dependent oxidoreductase (luciferase family)